MIIDTSALLAILFDEPEAAAFAEAIEAADRVMMSTANYVEAAIRVDNLNDPVISRLFDKLIKEAIDEIEPVTVHYAVTARAAYRDFGKGRHPAGLNFGDCFSYALASDLGMPLLFKGNDFSKTDLVSAVEGG